jgi:plastocyanin
MTSTRVRIGRVLLATAFAAFAASAQAAQLEVSIDNFSFNPKQLTVKAGDTVTWVNRDDIPHTVVSQSLPFRSKVMDTDERVSFTFTAPGSFTYFCSLHPMMTGSIVVDGGAGH